MYTLHHEKFDDSILEVDTIAKHNKGKKENQLLLKH